MNVSIIIGNLGSDAEVVNSNGNKFISFRVADSRKYKKADGTEVTETNWIDAVISNVDHPVLPYLKKGVKVAIIGSCSTRVYSSKKDRCMKAGQTIHVFSIELCGGSSDIVPRQLIDPATGSLHQTQKFYTTDLDTSKFKKEERYTMVDMAGNQYEVVKGGWVRPVQPSQDPEENAS